MGYLGGQPSRENTVAYCNNPKHFGYLSVKLIKNHKCLDKQCRYLQPYEDKPFWINRKRIKREKKLKEYIKKGNIEGIGELIAEIITENFTEE